MVPKSIAPFKTEREFWNAFFVEEQLIKRSRGISGTKYFNMIVQSMKIRRFLALKPWKRW